MNKYFGIGYFDVALCMKQKQRRDKKKERDKSKEPKESKKKDKKKGRRREKERGREKESGKGGGQKMPGRKKGKHSKLNKKAPFLGGKTGFFLLKTEKGKGKNNKKPNKKNK